MQSFPGGSAWPHVFLSEGSEKPWASLEGLLGPTHAPAMAVRGLGLLWRVYFTARVPLTGFGEILGFPGGSAWSHACPYEGCERPLGFFGGSAWPHACLCEGFEKPWASVEALFVLMLALVRAVRGPGFSGGSAWPHTCPCEGCEIPWASLFGSRSLTRSWPSPLGVYM